MSFETILFISAVMMVFPLSKAIERKAQKEREEREKEARREAEKVEEGERYRDIVWKAYLGLKRQHASGYGPWISAVIGRRGEAPRTVTRGIALEALRRTRDELAGSRFDLSGLEAAMEEMGAGE